MAEFLQPLLGRYALQFDVCFRTSIRFLLCAFLYSCSLRQKKHILLRIGFGFLTLLIFCGIVSWIRTDFDYPAIHIVSRMINHLLPLPMLFFFYQERNSTLLLSWCAGIATEELAVHFFYLLITLSGSSAIESNSLFPDRVPLRDAAISYAIQISIYVLCIRLFGRTQSTDDADKIMQRNIAALSVVSALALGILGSVTREYQRESQILYVIILCFVFLLSVFILLLRTSILNQGKYRTEISLMEHVLYEGKKQYESIKENIDIINMKCHDLKHQLANFEGRLTAQEIQALQQAVSIYDRSIRTGSETLDVLLFEKQLVCQKEMIKLSCMADGAALSFMPMTHIYALFNNAIGNAIEAARQVPDPEKRIISITVRREGENLAVNVTNYFAGKYAPNAELRTTKDDPAHHGFGIKSMKYIVEQYNGTFSASVRGERFSLDITFPSLPTSKGGGKL